MYKSVGVFRRRSLNEFLLRKRFSRKPQTITAPGVGFAVGALHRNQFRHILGR